MNKEFFIENRKAICDYMEDNSILVLFSGKAPHKSADEMYQFTPNKNFYYLTGIDKENIILMIMKKNNLVTEFLFLEEDNPILARWIGHKLSSEKAKELSGVSHIDLNKNFKELLFKSVDKDGYDMVYLDLEGKEWCLTKIILDELEEDLINKYSNVKINNIYNKISELRAIKRQEEIEKIKQAIDITKDGIELMMKKSKPGMREYEIEAYFDYVLTSNGIRDKAFKTIAASGVNGTVLHYSDNNGICNENDLILFDLGAQYKYYNADISRTFPVGGRFTKRQKEVYNVVLNANKEIIRIAKPGVSFIELNNIAKEVLAEGCKEIGLIKENVELHKYYFHSIGHSLGLDAHDVGDRDVMLKPGMVITDEPGLYIPEEGIGIRIEDDLLITENGCENLTKDVIKTVEEIEEFMNK